MRDCTVFSANAQKFFNALESFFPPDPWGKPNWYQDGIIYDNGRYDLKLAADREKLEQKIRGYIGYHIELQASMYLNKYKTLVGFENHVCGSYAKDRAELLLKLKDLDFQIETMDLVDEVCEIDLTVNNVGR